MSVEAPQSLPSAPPEALGPDAGVIKDARRRRQRERRFIAAVLAVGAVGLIAWRGVDAPGGRALAVHVAPRALTGSPLIRPTHLRLMVSEEGRVSIIDVDSGRVQAVHGMGLPRQYRRLTDSLLGALTPASGGALAVVTSLNPPPGQTRAEANRQNCAQCIVTNTNFLIGPSGSVRRESSLTLARDQQSTQALGSTVASWVLTRPRSGRCTLRLVPGSHPAGAVPCGTLGADTAAGVVIMRGRNVSLIDPRTGRVLERVGIGAATQFDFLGHDTALIGSSFGNSSGGAPDKLALVNLSTGARTHLRWPSILRFGYSVLPEPHGPLAAVKFSNPADPGPRQASDVWSLDSRTGKFTHVPGFPIWEDLKASNIAWTTDQRLVVAARYGNHGTLGVWRPGSARIQVGRLPLLTGYLDLVALSR